MGIVDTDWEARDLLANLAIAELRCWRYKLRYDKTAPKPCEIIQIGPNYIIYVTLLSLIE